MAIAVDHHSRTDAAKPTIEPVFTAPPHPADQIHLHLRQRPAAMRPHWPRRELSVTQVADLVQIFEPGIAACILRRPRQTALARWLATHTPTQCAERAARIDLREPVFDGLLRDFPEQDRGAITTELTTLCELFATLTDSEQVGLRLGITHQAQCPRFHVDRVPLRMICTWQGPGTEWLRHDDANRRYLGAGNRGKSDMESGLLLPGASIQRLNPFDIAVFKGERWPGHAGRGVVHRSPGVNAIQPHRVVVTLDEI